MFSLHQRACGCVSTYLLAPSPVGLADSLRGHMADRNYTLCASLSGEYLSASVCSFRVWNSQCLFGFTQCVGADAIVHIARGQCTARWRLFELHNYRAIHVICRPTWSGGRATEYTGGSCLYELSRSCRLFVAVKWLQVLHCDSKVLCHQTKIFFFLMVEIGWRIWLKGQKLRAKYHVNDDMFSGATRLWQTCWDKVQLQNAPDWKKWFESETVKIN